MNRKINTLLEGIHESLIAGIKTGDTVEILSRVGKGSSRWETNRYRKGTEHKVMQGSSVGGILRLASRFDSDGMALQLSKAKDQEGTFWLQDTNTYSAHGNKFKRKRKLRVRVVEDPRT